MSSRVGVQSPIPGQLVSAAILVAFAAVCLWWSAMVVHAAEAEPETWPQVCRVIQPEDLDR